MNILVCIPKGQIRDAFIPLVVAKQLLEIGSVTWNVGNDNYSAVELRQKLAGIDVCVTGWGNACFDADVLSCADSLKLVAHTGGSVAPYVSNAFFDQGLKVISGNNMYAQSVAEGVIAYMLCSLRELPRYMQDVQIGRWSAPDSFSEGLLNQSVGLIGFGMVAKHLVRMLQPFHAKIKVFDPYITDEGLAGYPVTRTSLNDILSNSKIVSIHAPKRPETYHMINADLLKLLRDGSLLVNTARGSIIDEDALAAELQTGRFKAVLDVFETEPLPDESKLRGLSNVLLMPHMAGPTYDRRKLVTIGLIEEMKRFKRGEPLHWEIPRNYALSMTL